MVGPAVTAAGLPRPSPHRRAAGYPSWLSAAAVLVVGAVVLLEMPLKLLGIRELVLALWADPTRDELVRFLPTTARNECRPTAEISVSVSQHAAVWNLALRHKRGSAVAENRRSCFSFLSFSPLFFFLGGLVCVG